MTLKLVTDNETGPRSGRPLPIIAIDGPAGAGKSTAARLLAYRLGFLLIDTGALYRVLALNALQADVSLMNGPRLAELCRSLEIQFGKLGSADGGAIPRLPVFCNGQEVTDLIRTAELGMAASNVSKLPEVREALLQMQRDFGVKGGIVMEGRDIGTIIFPDAEMKFYLTASVESRAKRRWEELQAAGSSIQLEQVVRETQARDDQDSNRPVAPLRRAADARLIDSTSRSLEEVVQEMATLVREEAGKKL
jgi:cytidylate kinase